MRIIESGKLKGVLELGEVPRFDELHRAIELLDVMSEEYTIDEEAFVGSRRVVGTTKYGPEKQKYSTADRTQKLNDALEAQIAWLQTIYPGTVPTVIQCATLMPGQEILWHIDSNMYQSVSHKVHMPIWTNEQAFYEFKGILAGSMNFKVGRAYEINNILMHRSINNGNTPRTHAIVDMIIETELERMLARGIDPIFTNHPVNKRTELRLQELSRAKRI